MQCDRSIFMLSYTVCRLCESYYILQGLVTLLALCVAYVFPFTRQNYNMARKEEGVGFGGEGKIATLLEGEPPYRGGQPDRRRRGSPTHYFFA